MDTPQPLQANGHKRPHSAGHGKTYKKRRHEYQQMRVNLEKTVDGRYRNDRSDYDRVGALLLCWQDDDLEAWTREVVRLGSIFKEQYSYDVHQFRIPSDRAVTATHKRVADFAHQYDGPNNLMILYYGGHGFKEDNRLKLYAKMEGNGDGDPSTFFDGVVWSLQHCNTDVLVVTDCCHAALAFSRVEVGKRKFELLTATGPTQFAYTPTSPMSFSAKLCDTLEDLAAKRTSFTTSKLYRELYFKTNEEVKPFLFDQSQNDWGRVSLRPTKFQGEPIEPDDPSVSGPENAELCLHMELRLSSQPKLNMNMLMMNDLARAMQYLPHVNEIKFKHMHAPAEDLKQFMRGVNQAMRIRPLLRRLRKRIEARKERERQQQESLQVDEPPHDQLPTDLHPKTSLLYSWNESQLDMESAGTPQTERDLPMEPA
ncbi:Hypothetical predicted protein [Lecanosticta acicola]|uniref:Peptidase C14 caspase domain-containing protein n=1 Tax=Lecanosticta acicola TaxID=111012 RepID=A0AAI9EFC1_9PEZI|nr:Hypothetical predicted protein [Lecanosticta acicola]